ncbi:aldehyde dehydrogenase family protein [Natronorubrum sp. FCH18a]|uniref:aldehyde dehydrogenase family protein n=1 Tax=Natronorubrum sp. FCH18a TaxID=3447018 RepID=UPI003F51AAEC
MGVTLPQLSRDCQDLFIDGDWCQPTTGERLSISSPIDRSTIAAVPAAGPDDVDAAYDAATAAQNDWADETPTERAAVLEHVAELLEEHENAIVSALAVEAGSTGIKGRVEVENAARFVEYAATLPFELLGETGPSSVPDKENRVRQTPAGVIGVISPWNFPLSLTMRAVAPAVALGNSVVIKPSSETPMTGALLIAKLFEMSGVPDGVVNIVTGRGSDIGDEMAAHPAADVMAFTGSTGVGRRVSKLAAEQLTEQAMELGGNNPHIVLDDATVDDAVDAGLFGTFLHQGQVCISVNRHLVHESIYDEYVESLATRAAALPVGDPRDSETVIGPIINESQRDELVEYITRTEREGGEIVTGGEFEDLYVEPTVISGATNEMAAACNEHFGPIAPVIPFSSDDKAVRIANDTEYGLAASVYGGDLDRATAVGERLETGMVHINDQPINSNPHIPFGGRKASGMGQFNGDAIVRTFTEPQWISVQREPRTYPF